MTAPTGEGGVNREFPNWPRNTEGGERWVGTVLGKKFVVDKGGDGDHKQEMEGGKGGMGPWLVAPIGTWTGLTGLGWDLVTVTDTGL